MNDIVKKEQAELAVNQPNPIAMIQSAVDAGRGIDEISKLMDLEDRFFSRQAKQAYIQAMATFQLKCPVIKTMKNGHNYKYAPLGDIVAQIKTTLSDCGLSFRFEQTQENNLITVTCIITHKDGHSESLSMSGTADTSGSKNAIQAIGSAVTYLRRYTLTGALGIVTADEDSDGRVDAAKGITDTDKAWCRGIRAGTNNLEDIEDLQYRAHIAGLLEK